MRLTTDEMVQMKNYFFSEGVCLVEDNKEELHPELKLKNGEVMKFFKSLVSKGIARREFVWKHAYYFITPAGISMLRDELCLKKQITQLLIRIHMQVELIK